MGFLIKSCPGLLIAMSFLSWLTGPAAILNAEESLALFPSQLTNVQQVLAFGLDATRPVPVSVRLQGSVTYADAAAHIIYVQQSSAGIRVVYTNADYPPAAEQFVAVDGTAAAGLFAPYVDCADLHVLGVAAIPTPVEASAARMAAGEFSGQWVQVEGVVRDVAKDAEGAILLISSGGQRFQAMVQPFPGSRLPTDWIDAQVALQGVGWTEGDAENKPTSLTLYVPGTNHLSFVDRIGMDVFRQPARPLSSNPELLRQSDHRIKVTGAVAFHSPDGYVYLEGEGGVVSARLFVPLPRGRSQTRYLERPTTIPLQPGERVELIGAPTTAAFTPLLTDAEFRRVGKGAPPAPIFLSASELFAGKFEGKLVALKARLLATETRQEGNLNHQVFALQSGDTIFDALWEYAGSNSIPNLAKNSYIRCTGICRLELSELNQIRSFRVLLRGPADLQLLGQPPWWEPLPIGRILSLTFGLTCIAVVWIWLLRRQVVQRTAQLQTEISQRRLAEEELQHALTAERELNELRSRFISMVSHEFRTPLGVVLSAAENLDHYFERLKPEQRRTQLDYVIQSTRQMAKVMENVLFIGRVEAGKLEFRPRPMDLIAFCGDIVRQVESSSESRCRICFRPGVLAAARGDENLLQHILTNLLTNAVKYSKENAAIEFTLERLNGDALFRVQDHGIGIPVADQKQLFTSFYRGSNVGQVSGTGLGLVVVKRCVELHGGRISFQSSEREGTAFEVELPLFKAS